MTNHILLTFDIEDWFQVENFKECIPFPSWSSYELRVEKNTHRILDLLDSIETKNKGDPSEIVPPRRKFYGAGRRQETGGPSPLRSDSESAVVSNQFSSSPSSVICPPSSGSPKATFFVLGWIGERLPHLVREIHRRGHEVASHGYYHELCDECTRKDLRKDLTDSKRLLEDIIGDKIYGYRAPCFSISTSILKIIQECGYFYDSSYNSYGMHGRYGEIDLSTNGKNAIAANISNSFYELPISNIKLGNLILPWGGGGYFRLIPFPIFRLGVQAILKKQKTYLFYMHPWEIDSAQPRLNEVPRLLRFRHYANLHKTQFKLTKFLENFNDCRFLTCREYLEKVTTKAPDGTRNGI